MHSSHAAKPTQPVPQEPGFSSGSPIWVQGLKHLGRPLLPSREH